MLVSFLLALIEAGCDRAAAVQAFATAASSEEAAAQLAGLEPGSEYELRAYAINQFGASQPSESRK